MQFLPSKFHGFHCGFMDATGSPEIGKHGRRCESEHRWCYQGWKASNSCHQSILDFTAVSWMSLEAQRLANTLTAEQVWTSAAIKGEKHPALAFKVSGISLRFHGFQWKPRTWLYRQSSKQLSPALLPPWPFFVGYLPVIAKKTSLLL
jgi:hypothetical protein